MEKFWDEAKERELLEKWVAENFTSQDQMEAERALFENFGRGYKASLENIEGGRLLCFLAKELLLEPKLDDLQEFGVPQNNINNYVREFRIKLVLLMRFPLEKTDVLKVLLIDGFDLLQALRTSVKL
jgi:hypothetical protein